PSPRNSHCLPTRRYSDLGDGARGVEDLHLEHPEGPRLKEASGQRDTEVYPPGNPETGPKLQWIRREGGPVMPEPNHIQIGEVAERTGSPLRTIRYYGEVGSMEPSARSRGGFRLHTETDVDGSALIEWRKPLGFGLEETREPLERLDRSDSAEIFLQERKPLSEGLDVLETAIA